MAALYVSGRVNCDRNIDNCNELWKIFRVQESSGPADNMARYGYEHADNMGNMDIDMDLWIM